MKERDRGGERIDYAWRLAAGRRADGSGEGAGDEVSGRAARRSGRVKEFALAVFNLNAFLYVN